MNGYKEPEGYHSFLQRRRALVKTELWTGGTIMNNISSASILKDTATHFTNANPNADCIWRKKRSRNYDVMHRASTEVTTTN